jgi:hypothetical protein
MDRRGSVEFHRVSQAQNGAPVAHRVVERMEIVSQPSAVLAPLSARRAAFGVARRVESIERFVQPRAVPGDASYGI